MCCRRSKKGTGREKSAKIDALGGLLPPVTHHQMPNLLIMRDFTFKERKEEGDMFTVHLADAEGWRERLEQFD